MEIDPFEGSDQTSIESSPKIRCQYGTLRNEGNYTMVDCKLRYLRVGSYGQHDAIICL
jgi:hypothetical protein